MLLMLGLRRYAFKVFQEEADVCTDVGDAGGTASKDNGVRLPFPLWEAMHSTSGFAFLVILAPVTIMSWSVAVPLTLVIVPLLILVRPLSIQQRPLRSLIVFVFLVFNGFLLVAPPATRQ